MLTAHVPGDSEPLVLEIAEAHAAELIRLLDESMTRLDSGDEGLVGDIDVRGRLVSLRVTCGRIQLDVTRP